MYDFSSTQTVNVPWLVLQGGKDDVVPPQQVSSWVHKQANQPEYQWLGDADHFFHGRLNNIRNLIKDRWQVAA